MTGKVWIVALAGAALLGAPAPGAAQQLPGSPLAIAHGGTPAVAGARYRDPPVSASRRYIVIALEEHRLYLMDREKILWSAIVGTGTGTRLEGAGQKWDFSTPRGMFRVQAKAKDPPWYVPDWAWIERGLPIPPDTAAVRWETGMLGTTALYLEENIAVHGTNKPELLGRSVSHGCIRMTNEAARRLYHEVEVGTPVIIY